MSDILLLITTICLVILTLSIVAVMAVIFRILSDLKDVLHIIKHESTFIAGDIHELRQKIRDRAETTSKIAGLLTVTRVAHTFFKWASYGTKRRKLTDRI